MPKAPFSSAFRLPSLSHDTGWVRQSLSRVSGKKSEAAEYPGGVSTQPMANRHQFPFFPPPNIHTAHQWCDRPGRGEGSRGLKVAIWDLKQVISTPGVHSAQELTSHPA